jgi:hypothetical protein
MLRRSPLGCRHSHQDREPLAINSRYNRKIAVDVAKRSDQNIEIIRDRSCLPQAFAGRHSQVEPLLIQTLHDLGSDCRILSMTGNFDGSACSSPFTSKPEAGIVNHIGAKL